MKNTLESELPSLLVKGEISNYTAHRSGHWYFSLKDQKSQVMAVMFRGNNSRVSFQPKNGDEILVRARIAVYEPRGNYQLVCESMEPMGAGDLQRQFEELKKKLASEGLFDPKRKQALPKFPKQLAVVTSPTGAAIRDILNVLKRRFKGLEVTIFPCKVQGEMAAKEIREQVARVNELGYFDAMIVGRGGGSAEDLWCFNDESLAREISMSSIPVISAVGHEIDFTISDFVADLRAPTPSAAAELVAANSAEWIEKINQSKKRLWRAMQNAFLYSQQNLYRLKKQLGSPEKLLETKNQRLDDLRWRLDRLAMQGLQSKKQSLMRLRAGLQSPQQKLASIEQNRKNLEGRLIKQVQMLLQNKKQNLVNLKDLEQLTRSQISSKKSELHYAMGKLDSLSPLRVLERGYAIPLKDDQVIKKSTQLKVGDELELRFSQGKATTKVLQLEE